MPTDPLRVHLGTTTILKGWNSISPETCYQVACCRYHHPERMESISPGLRGTSYPGSTATDAGYPERVVSNSSARPGGSIKMHPPPGSSTLPVNAFNLSSYEPAHQNSFSHPAQGLQS